MWPFKSKYEKITREDVVNAIIKLEDESDKIEAQITAAQQKIDDMMKRGKVEKDRNVKLLLAKKITFTRDEMQENVKRVMYLMYNIKLLNRLKNAIDDNQFFENTSSVSLGNLLADQKGLAKFLNKTLNTKVKAEDVLTSADDIFNDVQSAYEENETIYGINEQDDALLSMFETEGSMDDDPANIEEADDDLSVEENKQENRYL